MLTSLRKWIAGRDQRSPAAVRGAQKLALIDQKTAHARAALQAAERALADLVARERAGLQQTEATLLGLIAKRGGVDPAEISLVRTVISQTLISQIAAQIGEISVLAAQTAARLAVLKEAGIAGRALRLEHIGHSGAVDQVLACTGPEAADRLMARLARVAVQGGCRALSGGAANLELQIG